jgi:hypothetical protein
MRRKTKAKKGFDAFYNELDNRTQKMHNIRFCGFQKPCSYQSAKDLGLGSRRKST